MRTGDDLPHLVTPTLTLILTLTLTLTPNQAMTFFTYRDVNLVYAYRPDDVEPQSLRKKLMGALRYGTPG